MELNKEIFAAFPESFKAEDLATDAMKTVIETERQEAVTRIGRLITKEYQTRRELSQKRNEVKKLEESLAKSQAKMEKVKAGDLSVLFEGEKQEQKTQEI